MPYKSTFPPLDIPKLNILDYLYPPDVAPSHKPIWIDAERPDRSFSAHQMQSWVRRIGYGLDRLPIPRGEVVLVVSPNHILVPAAFQGIVGSGRIFTGVNPNSSELELLHQIEDTGARLILVDPSCAANAVKAAERAKFPKDKLFLLAVRPTLPVDGVLDWRFLIGTEDEGNSWTWDDMGQTADTTIATLNYSSGTTGLPKGVCVTHANIVANLAQTICMRSAGFLKPVDERWVGFLPLYHGFGQFYVCLMAAKLSSQVYIMEKFSFNNFLSHIQTYRITHLQVVPPILVMLDKRPERSNYNLSSIKEIISAAAPLSRELQNSMQEKLRARVIQGWGMTELTCGGMQVPSGEYVVSGTVGRLYPNCECRLVDDAGKSVTPGEPGEIWIRGPNVCLGYWRNPAATKELIDSDGWLRTGDIAICQHSYFYIVDRKKELIKVNGMQVAPAELEALLLGHENVIDVGVVGIVIARQEWPRAYVKVRTHGMEEVTEWGIQEYVQSRVAKHKQLRGGVQFVKEIPRSMSGKILRKVLKEWSKRDAVHAKL